MISFRSVPNLFQSLSKSNQILLFFLIPNLKSNEVRNFGVLVSMNGCKIPENQTKMNHKLLVISFLLFFSGQKIQAQQLPHMDSVEMLLTSMAVQMEATEAVDAMYNFEFRSAKSQFMRMRRFYPEHPLPYFLLGLCEWWQMMPNMDQTKHDKKFLAYMDSTIQKADILYEKSASKKLEAAFFLAGAYGFKGRLHGERHHWSKATVAGKNALKYMEIAEGKGDLSPEFLFGDALYNYFAVWIPENYPMLKPVLWFFKKGDKDKGIKQLETVVSNAFYTKTEAQYYLMRIYAAEPETQTHAKALEISKYLFQTYPNNAYFHRYYARMLYTKGLYTPLEPVAYTLMQRVDSAWTGYEATSGRYAGFFLGSIYRARGEVNKAITYYKKAVQYSEKLEAYQTGYYLYSLATLAQYADTHGDMTEAYQYYEKIKKYAPKKHATRKDALKYLQKNKRKYKKATAP